jgi:EAL domain-containing protein (putative c-di-GMP-specific phosphodiesterase class I)
VLREACRQAREWVDADLPVVSIAVNVSAVELRNERYLANLLTVLDETGMDPKWLELELTESVLMTQADSVAIVLQKLRERGVEVTIDDFGTGYSSLSYLRKFPIDILKIDQSFVSQITADGDVTSIVPAIISMARGLKLRVVGEGVETLDQLSFLQALGCDEAQGYYFSRPVPPAEFAELLTSGMDRGLGVGNRPGRAPTRRGANLTAGPRSRLPRPGCSHPSRQPSRDWNGRHQAHRAHQRTHDLDRHHFRIGNNSKPLTRETEKQHQRHGGSGVGEQQSIDRRGDVVATHPNAGRKQLMMIEALVGGGQLPNG